MTKITLAAVVALLVAGMTPALAKEDCEAGYKSFMTKMTTHVADATPGDIAEAVRKGLKAYDSCKAGDSFTPHGVWDEVLASMKK